MSKGRRRELWIAATRGDLEVMYTLIRQEVNLDACWTSGRAATEQVWRSQGFASPSQDDALRNTLRVQMHFSMRAREHNAVIFVSMFLQTPRHLAPFAVKLASACFRNVGHASFGSTIRDGVYNVLECFGVFFVGEF